ncbi:uncharacterized protein E6C27_scaffold128G00470 [Cucumis melo var. makuwa]|uniref:Uncharacterized protein n=1 Tax=Cucumis melo var. makuwa TaxID=1194695 RepID=A0A5A7TCE3_CUCMM|nr:uncharacterized protein E6C27_scaffold128G00470 [Cucumis melo var. makuwa]
MHDEKNNKARRLTGRRAPTPYCLHHVQRKCLPYHVPKRHLSEKERMNDCETIALMQATSYIFRNGVLEKVIDLRSFREVRDRGGVANSHEAPIC